MKQQFRGLSPRSGRSRQKPRRAGFAPTDIGGAAGARSSASDTVDQLLFTVRPEQINFDFNGDSHVEAAGRSFAKLYDPKGVANAIEWQTYNTTDSAFGYPIKAVGANSITIGAGHDESSQLLAGLKLRVEGSVSNDGIYEIASIAAYVTASQQHVVTTVESIPDTGDATGRVTWVRSEDARTGSDFDLTYEDDEGNTIPYESGQIGSDEECYRIITSKLLRTHNNVMNIRCEFVNALGNIDYAYANHTYDVDNRARLEDYEVWVDAGGQIVIRFVGDEDTRSLVFMHQTSAFSHPTFAAMIADFRANGILIPNLSETSADGYQTGEFVSGSSPLYVALLPYGEANPTLATSEAYGLYARYLYVDTISGTVEFRPIKEQVEQADPTHGHIVRKGKLTLRVTDGAGEVTSVYARHTDHTLSSVVSGGNVSKFSAWLPMSDGGQTTYDITAVDQGAKKFTIAEDATEDFFPGQKLEVTGANAGVYSISSVTYTTSTAIVVTEDIPSATADGTVGIKGQSDYSVLAPLSEKADTFIEWKISTERGVPITGEEVFDFDAIPELSGLDADLTYDFGTNEFKFNLNYRWDEDVSSVKLLLRNSITSGVTLGATKPAAQDVKWAGTGLPSETVLVNEPTPDGLISFKIGDTVAAGSMTSIKRGDYLWWYAIAIDADGRANATVYSGRVLVATAPKVLPEYSQSSGFAAAKIWIKDYAPAGQSYIESVKYRVGKPIDGSSGFSGVGAFTSSTAGPDGTGEWDGYYAIGGSGDAFLLDRKHNLQLEWIATFKKYVEGVSTVGGSHTYDTDRNATLRTNALRKVAVGNSAYKIVLDFFGDDDTKGVAWKYEQKSTEGPTDPLGYYPNDDLLAGQFFNGSSGNDITIVPAGSYDPKQWLYVALTALPAKNVAEDDWVAGDTLDVLGVPEPPVVLSISPDAIAPTVVPSYTQTGEQGTAQLVVSDPQLRVTAATYKIQLDPSTGYGSEVAWVPTGTTTKTYSHSFDLAEKSHSFLTWKITYTDGDGVSKHIQGTGSFDKNTIAEWESPPQLSVNGSNQPVFTWDMDEDGYQVRFEGQVGSPVTSFSGSAVVNTNNSGSHTFTTPLSEGETFYIRARAEKVGAVAGEEFVDSVILPSYTASPLSLVNARLIVSNGTLRIGYTGGTSVVGTYYTFGTDESFGIDAVSTGSETITVNGVDLTDRFGVGDIVTISGSTGNDGDYTITAISFSGGNTTFTFGGDDITDATADGSVTLKTLRDPDTNDSQIAQQVAFVNTGLTVGDNVTVTVKIAGYDSATPTPNLGTVYPLVVVADSNSAPQIFWISLDIDPTGGVFLNVGADDDTTDLYYEASTSSMPAGPITTGDSTTGQGSGIVQLTGISLNPGQSVFIRLAAYNSGTSEFGPEWQLRGTFQELPDFDQKPSLDLLSPNDPATQSGWGPGQASVDFKLNTAANRVKYRIAHSSAPVGSWTTKILTAGATGSISHAEFVAAGGNYASSSGVPEGKHVVLQIQASDGTKDGKIYQFAQMYGAGDTVLPTFVMTPSYGFDAINEWYYGRVQLDVTDPQGRIVEDGGVDQIKFSKKIGIAGFSGYALRDGGSGDTHYADVELDPEHGSEIRFQIPWLKKDGTSSNMESAYSFLKPIDPKITNMNLSVGPMIDNKESADYRKFPVYLSWESNRDTVSVRYLASATSNSNTTGGTVSNSRSGDAVLVGNYTYNSDVYVAIEPFNATAAGGYAGEIAQAHVKTPTNPRIPHFEDNALVPIMLANPPFSGTVDATPVLLSGGGGYEYNQLVISGSISIPGHGAKVISHSGVVSEGELVWNTNLTGDPGSEIGLQFGGDSSAEGVFLLGYITDIDNDGSGNPPFFVTANGRGVFTAPIMYAGSFTALLGNVKTLEVEKRFTLLPGGEFAANPTWDVDDITRITGTFIDDTGIEGWYGGTLQAQWRSDTGEITAGAGAVRLTSQGIVVDTDAFGVASLKISDEGIELPYGFGLGGVPYDVASITWGGVKVGAFKDFVDTEPVFSILGATRVVVDGDLWMNAASTLRTENITTADTLADLNLTTLGPGSVKIKGVAFPHSLAGKGGYALSVKEDETGIEWSTGAGVLSGMGDVVIGGDVTDDHILVRSGTDWINVLGTTKFAAASHTLDSHSGKLSVAKLSLPSAPSDSYFLKADFDTDPAWSTISTSDISDWPSTFAPAAHSYDSHTGTVPLSDIETNESDGGTQTIIATNGGVPVWGLAPVGSHTLASHTGLLSISQINSELGSTGEYLRIGVGGLEWDGVAWADISGKPTTFAPSSHSLDSHSGTLNIDKIAKPSEGQTLVLISTGLTTSWGSAPVASHSLDSHTGVLSLSKLTPPAGTPQDVFLRYDTDTISWGAVDWSDLANKPSTFAPAAHSLDFHSGFLAVNKLVQTTNIGATPQSLLSTSEGAPYWGFAPVTSHAYSSHTGTVPLDDITPPAPGPVGYVLRFDTDTISWGSLAWGDVTGKPTTFTPSSHTLDSHTGFLSLSKITKPAEGPTNLSLLSNGFTVFWGEAPVASHDFDSHTGFLDAASIQPPGVNDNHYLFGDVDTVAWVTSIPWGDLSGVPLTFAPSSHAISSHTGTLSNSQLVVGNVTQFNTSIAPDWDNIQEKPLTFAPSSHAIGSHTGTLSDGQLVASNVTQFNASISPPWANITGVPLTFAPTPHSFSQHTDTLADAQLVSSNVTQFNSVIAPTWANISGKPTTFAPESHTLASHTGLLSTASLSPAGGSAGQFMVHNSDSVSWSDVSWASITGKPTTFTPASHSIQSHTGVLLDAQLAESNITQFNSQIAPAWVNITGKPSSFTPASHSLASHTGLLSPGSIDVSTANNGDVMTTNGTTSYWAALSVAWANITGKPSTFAPSSHSLDSHSGTLSIGNIAKPSEGPSYLSLMSNGISTVWGTPTVGSHAYDSHTGTVPVDDIAPGGAGTLFMKSISGLVQWGVAGSDSGTYTFVTYIEAYSSGIRYKTRNLTTSNGIVSVGAESAFINVPLP